MKPLDHLYDWIAKIIDSCNHQVQLDSAAVLVERYLEIQKDEQKHTELCLRLDKRSMEIHYVVN
jgi:hypothetical protein